MALWQQTSLESLDAPSTGRVQKVAVVTDSSACLPLELAAQHGIEVVPFTMAFGDQVYRDGIDEPGDFYRQLRLADKLPKTAAPSPAAFLDAFQRASIRGAEVLCIMLPANLSSAQNACTQAIAMAEKEMRGVRIKGMAGGAVAAGQGLVVLEAARAAARGAGLEEAAALAESLAPQVHFFAFLDTLEFLAKGGHVPKAAAWLGNLVGLRPVLTAPYGEVKRIAQARSRRGATDWLLRLVEQHNPTLAPIQAMVMHANSLEEAESLSDRLRRRFPCQELYITQFTPVMGAHSGPGALGIAFRIL